MGIKLIVKMRGEPGKVDAPSEHELSEQIVTLGRDKTCTVVLGQQAVSRNHARISQDGQLFFVEDLGSAFGTQLNGKKLPKGEKRLLNNGDVIAIAAFDVTFNRTTDIPKDGGEKTSYVAKAMVREALGSMKKGESPYLRVMNGPREGERIELNEGQEVVLGRDASADVSFDDDLMSRKHLKVRRDWSGTHVEDLGSRNGIKINRKKQLQKTLANKDELEVGGVKLLFVDPTAVQEPPADLEPSYPSVAAYVPPVKKQKKEEAPPEEEEAPPEEAPPAKAKPVAPLRAAAARAKKAEPAPPPPDEENSSVSEIGEHSMATESGDEEMSSVSQFADPGYDPNFNYDDPANWELPPLEEPKKPNPALELAKKAGAKAMELIAKLELPPLEMPREPKQIAAVAVMGLLMLVAISLVVLLMVGI